MAARGDSDDSPRQPRHYPLDIPHLPFNRYEHRRITARDIMVHRLMAEVMNPSQPCPTPLLRDPPPAYASMISEYPLSEVFGQPLSDHTIRLTQDGGFRRQNTMARGTPNGPWTFGNHFLDLATRHYFETDDVAMRVYVSRAGLPRMPVGPLPPGAHPFPSRRDVQSSFRLDIKIHQDQNHKGWQDYHESHLSRLRQRVSKQDQLLSLYDGGACLPRLRQAVDRQADGLRGASQGLNDSHWTMGLVGVRFSPLLVWPEGNCPMRHILQPTWADRDVAEHCHPLSIKQLPTQWPLDLSLRAGRGRNCDGIWATGQKEGSSAHGKGGPGGDSDSRGGRPRRRCTSEPPPGIFVDGVLPSTSAVVMAYSLRIIHPRMTLSQLDRRSRRRSLSRTHIEEMFDWNTNLDAISDPPADDHSTEQPRCENCTARDHLTYACRSPCGHCGALCPKMALESGNRFRPRKGQRPRSYITQSPHLAPQCPVARGNRCKCGAFPTFHTAHQCGIPCRRACGAPASPGSFQHRNAMTCRARCCMCGLRGHSGRECRLKKCRCGGAHLGQDCGWKPGCRVKGCDRFLCGIHCRECGSTGKPFVGWRCGKCLGFEKPLEWGAGKDKRRRRKKGESKETEGQGDGDQGDGDQEHTEEPESTTAAVTPNFEPPVAAAATLPIIIMETEPEKEPQNEGYQSVFGDPRANR
ncbi:hypothetical protein C8A00DRAFT_15739 [Chaetomidium leptoderma]|uniref:Uncharacterized protein n=1 Tax=Chaetomidium leptoderma TaxID=669021 RepID=A0AAN6VLL7_9PEZI|nr:hypothetical protein C8A00DRAFT_15739 [Chaetomidium leptoderma]